MVVVSAAAASESSVAPLPTSPVGSAAVAVDSEAWMYQVDTSPNSNACNDQQQAQGICLDVNRYGRAPQPEPLYTIPDDSNDAPLEISIEKAVRTAPVPVLDYSCSSLEYESSRCGRDSNAPTPAKPTQSASLRNGTHHGHEQICDWAFRPPPWIGGQHWMGKKKASRPISRSSTR